MLETIALRREKELLKENFAAIVSHELKAPLNAIQQNLFVIMAELAGKLTESQKGRLERMKSRLDDLLKLIHTWLRVLSVDVGKIKESFRPISVVPLISKAIETVQLHATRKDIDIVTSIEEPLRLIDGDEGTLVEVFVNILGNAITYSHVGSKVFIQAEGKGENILISISDTGVGISKEDLPFIFQDFYRGKSGKTAEGGYGLGLAISRRIVEAHNGSISVESEPGKGSTFVMSLPASNGGVK